MNRRKINYRENSDSEMNARCLSGKTARLMFLNIQVRELELMDIEKLPNCNKDPGKAWWSSMNEQKR